ncbi:ThuA domain-containing protein [Sphingomonas sp. LB-2]|uniref:ThuA domain-containing protein n=1 Tax=Sphingomonas caeni TaxID=2984949 RepID=UPI002231CD77|nr:ThuA domain-containing protein [Sphingomonas caeni]MCW3849421.1 ThuA domain-containing protein [Sphingomonas caeni]
MRLNRLLLSATGAALMLGAAAQGSSQQTVPAPTPSPTPFVKDPRYWPTPVMDQVRPQLPRFHRPHRVLIFSKTNGFRDDPQNKAATRALIRLATTRGWDFYASENAALFNREQLQEFDVIVLNSISGNVWTDPQRAAFKAWLERGGGLVALHGSGGDHHYDWQWYVDTVIGAQFIGHTYQPKQFQMGTILIADPRHPALHGIPLKWTREEEWYAFDRVPSGNRTHILATLDEASYEPAPEQRMGTHPIIWTRCVGRGRVFFSALGHKAETYGEPLHLRLIDNALGWASPAKTRSCV